LTRLFGGGKSSDLGCGTTDKVVFKTELLRLDLFCYFFLSREKSKYTTKKNPFKNKTLSLKPTSLIRPNKTDVENNAGRRGSNPHRRDLDPPYKRKFLILIKTTYVKLFLAQISFGTNQNTPKYNLA
jgi:hypothetical protein